MPTLNVIDPARMTAQERRTEIAAILRQGLIRLRTAHLPQAQEIKTLDLGFCPPPSVHTHTSNPVRKPALAVQRMKQKGV